MNRANFLKSILSRCISRRKEPRGHVAIMKTFHSGRENQEIVDFVRSKLREGEYIKELHTNWIGSSAVALIYDEVGSSGANYACVIQVTQGSKGFDARRVLDRGTLVPSWRGEKFMVNLSSQADIIPVIAATVLFLPEEEARSQEHCIFLNVETGEEIDKESRLRLLMPTCVRAGVSEMNVKGRWYVAKRLMLLHDGSLSEPRPSGAVDCVDHNGFFIDFSQVGDSVLKLVHADELVDRSMYGRVLAHWAEHHFGRPFSVK